MGKERITLFTDAVLAIIMTILVLELERPTPLNWSGLWELRENFFSYTLSFFWLGLMWLSHHNNWQSIKKVSNKTVFFTLLVLFFASFFPYTTSLVSTNFYNETAQTLYGVIILAVSFSNIGLSKSLNEANEDVEFGLLYNLPNKVVLLDLLIKIVGLIITVTIYPPAMIYAIFISVAILVFMTWNTGRNA